MNEQSNLLHLNTGHTEPILRSVGILRENEKINDDTDIVQLTEKVKAYFRGKKVEVYSDGSIALEPTGLLEAYRSIRTEYQPNNDQLEFLQATMPELTTLVGELKSYMELASLHPSEINKDKNFVQVMIRAENLAQIIKSYHDLFVQLFEDTHNARDLTTESAKAFIEIGEMNEKKVGEAINALRRTLIFLDDFSAKYPDIYGMHVERAIEVADLVDEVCGSINV
jgi:hypothetical protein